MLVVIINDSYWYLYLEYFALYHYITEYFFSFFFSFFEMGFHSAVQACLELPAILLPQLPSAVITAMCHHSWLYSTSKKNSLLKNSVLYSAINRLTLTHLLITVYPDYTKRSQWSWISCVTYSICASVGTFYEDHTMTELSSVTFLRIYLTMKWYMAARVQRYLFLVVKLADHVWFTLMSLKSFSLLKGCSVIILT